MSIAVIFPGQGSQTRGMGKDLFDKYPDWIEMANAILGYSVVDLCMKEEEKLGQTLYTQPALYIVNALSYRDFIDHGGQDPANIFMGHSLGEYNALLAAGAYDFQTGLVFAKKRAELMAEVRDGGMAAVIGLEARVLEKILAEQFPDIDIANYNSPGQYVISGKLKDIHAVDNVLKKSGAKRVIRLNVSGAFHSRYMKDVKKMFARFLEDKDFNPLEKKVIANVTADEYQNTKIKMTLASQIASPVRWIESVHKAQELGVKKFEEVGPGKVLSGLIKRILKK